ncbi:MAG: cellulase family glycosylhydrolase [Tepidisphaeraceae bacterium]
MAKSRSKKSSAKSKSAPAKGKPARPKLTGPASRWSAQQANDWYNNFPWIIGCNYAPATAINQLEMWQKRDFDLPTIKREIKLAQSLGFTSVRVFLHNLVYQEDRNGFFKRVDQFLSVLQGAGIGAMLVLFDSVWHPFPRLGVQREPEPGVHNSGWVQAPGLDYLNHPHRFDELHDYVVDTVRQFGQDRRVQVWDLWNEPDNANAASRGPRDLGAGKAGVIMPLLQKTHDWAREARPMQPLTTGIWLGDWSSDQTMKDHERLQIELSDVVSFHNYGPPDDMTHRIDQLSRFGRPMLCTEYMARGIGSTFEAILPVLRKRNVGAYNWGFVQGRTQTHLPWDSWQSPYVEREPDVWFHEIFRSNHKPYRKEEVKLIQKMTSEAGLRITD